MNTQAQAEGAENKRVLGEFEGPPEKLRGEEKLFVGSSLCDIRTEKTGAGLFLGKVLEPEVYRLAVDVSRSEKPEEREKEANEMFLQYSKQPDKGYDINTLVLALTVAATGDEEAKAILEEIVDPNATVVERSYGQMTVPDGGITDYLRAENVAEKAGMDEDSMPVLLKEGATLKVDSFNILDDDIVKQPDLLASIVVVEADSKNLSPSLQDAEMEITDSKAFAGTVEEAHKASQAEGTDYKPAELVAVATHKAIAKAMEEVAGLLGKELMKILTVDGRISADHKSRVVNLINDVLARNGVKITDLKAMSFMTPEQVVASIVDASDGTNPKAWTSVKAGINSIKVSDPDLWSEMVSKAFSNTPVSKVSFDKDRMLAELMSIARTAFEISGKDISLVVQKVRERFEVPSKTALQRSGNAGLGKALQRSGNVAVSPDMTAEQLRQYFGAIVAVSDAHDLLKEAGNLRATVGATFTRNLELVLGEMLRAA